MRPAILKQSVAAGSGEKGFKGKTKIKTKGKTKGKTEIKTKGCRAEGRGATFKP